VRMGAPIGGRSHLLQLAFVVVLKGVVGPTSATTITTNHRRTYCVELAERAEATVRELRDQVKTLQGTVDGLTANIRALVTNVSLQKRLLKVSTTTQPRGRRLVNESMGCRDYSGSGVCPTCGGGGAFDPCPPDSRCHSEINTTCTALQSVGNQPGFEYGWSSVHTLAECAAAVVCIDCSGVSSSTIDRVPCPPDGYNGVNTSRVLLLLDNTENLNLSSAFGTNTRYPRYMAGLSLSNATIDGSLLDMYSMRIGGNVNLSQTTV
jgi:hypothetical protein